METPSTERVRRSPSRGFTDVLQSACRGDTEAERHLWALVYDELHRMAHRHLLRERRDHTLSTTALVHEAYLRLVDEVHLPWQNRAHFLAVAARAMRRILIEYARRHRAQKRGGGRHALPFDEARYLPEHRAERLMALDEVLTRLEAFNPRWARVVECLYFGGFTQKETAAVLDVNERTVQRDWKKARAWLYGELYGRRPATSEAPGSDA